MVLYYCIGVRNVELLEENTFTTIALFGKDQVMAKDPRHRANQIVMDLCFRIERMCRYSPLDDKEISDQSIADRRTVEGLYIFYRNQDNGEEISARRARANAIRLLLCEVLS